MAESQNHLVQVEVVTEGSNFEPRVQTPLLHPGQNHPPPRQGNEEIQEDFVGTDLDKILQRLNSFLSILGFKQDSILSFCLSWTVFLLIGVLLPVLMLELSKCPGCEKGQIKRFEINIVSSQACLAAAALICLSHNLRKYGIRKFLFVDRYTGQAERFGDQYVQKIRVSSIVQVVGTILCLNAAAKITHRAQAIGSLASQWHALLTCSSTDTPQIRMTSSAGSLEVANMSSSLYVNYSESDLESMDFITTTTNTQLPSYISSYHKRQALVTYLQANPGGITVYGYTVDRVLINTIFVIELTLVLFVLGKTIVFHI